MREVIEEVIKAYGGISAVQKRFGYTEPMGVYNWRSRGIPKSLLAEIHVDTGIDVHRLKLGVGTQHHNEAAITS
ncbi:MAG: hypothetical protein R3332_00335 [Pseudohongiellaceae bacterium]|nr:hypothetical protein [Pseudohongiellaceae bacterium]